MAVVGLLLWMSDATRQQRVREGRGARGAAPSATAEPGGSSPFMSRLMVFGAASVLVLFAGLRYRVGTDYSGYVANYGMYKESFSEDFWSFNEPGIKALANVASWIRDEPSTLIFLASLMTVGGMLWTYARYSPAVTFSFVLFALAGPWIGSFNGVRQYLACAVLVLGHRFIFDRKPVRYALVILVASLFHASALLAFLLYLVPSSRLRPFGFVVVFVLSFVALGSSESVLGFVGDFKGDEVTSAYATTAVSPLRIAVACAPLLLYTMKPPAWAGKDEWFYRNLAVVHATVMLAASWSAYISRFGIYTSAFIPLFLVRLANFPDARTTSMVRTAIVLLYAVYWYLDVVPSDALNNYRTVFGG